MNDEELLRYSRQIMLPEFDVAGQERLQRSSALLIGCGGLGSPAGMYLAASGVGEITVVDHDRIDLSNLQRQIAYSENDLGKSKASVTASTLRKLNSLTRVTPITRELEKDELVEQARHADVVIDATDNFRSRYAINVACVQARRPLVSGAAIRMEGQVSVFDSRRDDSPCYRCLYDDMVDLELNCSENGVLSPVVGIVGAIQAMEAIKTLTGVGEPLVSYVLFIDAKRMDIRRLKLARNPKCPTCNAFR